ncbi:MAG: DNA mismatch repair protein MutS [Thermoplasmata archaeon]
MSEASSSTPLIEQYDRVRARYPGHLVLFRVGDFYETFGDDAKLLAHELDVQLTARAPDARGERTPMAGVPHHAVETYLARLVKKGHRVALCDQVEDPKEAKGLVRREVTRVVTPGTVVEDGILGGPEHNFLAILHLTDRSGAWAAVDVSTGEWYHGPLPGGELEPALAQLASFFPREMIVSAAPTAITAVLESVHREFPSTRIERAPPALEMCEMPERLQVEGVPDSTVDWADRSLAAYVQANQPRLLPVLALVERRAGSKVLSLDAKTLRHLEISRPMNPDDPNGATLIGAWDDTSTSAGRRTLGFWLAHPLAEPGPIAERLDSVERLLASGAQLAELRVELRAIPDLARIASRVAGRRVRPPELGALRNGLHRAQSLARSLPARAPAPLLQRLSSEGQVPEELLRLLDEALPEEIPATAEDGRLFRQGRVPEVDRAQAEETSALEELTELERSEQEATGIRTLKVRYNQVFGYYIEVGRSHLSRIPPHYRRRQTVSQAERFSTDRLEEIAGRILDARGRAREEEARQWDRFLAELDRHVPTIHRIGRALGAIDTLQSFAFTAQRMRCVRPEIDDSGTIVVRDGRHPVLDRLLGERFVPNDVELDRETARLLVLTGPNMSGKSTYMRQIGLLVVLAQAGAFVPAKFARVGLVSGLFTRMGFTDEIGRGKSSFMVEMTEVAEILRGADDRSLVLLDEVGRGTSTFDGLAIAWATLRHLHDVTRCRAVLATHYHQLTQLVEGLAAARQAHLAAKDRPDGVVFLHRLVPGATDRSYGVHVARLAGLPPTLLAEANRLLRRLEAEGLSLSTDPRSPLGGTRYAQALLVAADVSAPAPSAIEQELRKIDLDHLTPLEALKRIAELQAKLPPSTEDP